MMRKSKLLVLPLGVAAMMMLGGCYSASRAAYKSTPHSPKSVTVVDGVTFEAIWTYDIPVGHTLVVEFDPQIRTANPKTLKWALYTGDNQDLMQNYPDWTKKTASGELDLPGGPIKTDVVLRASPELPGSSPPQMESAPTSDSSTPAASEDTADVDDQIQQEVDMAEQVIQEQDAVDEAEQVQEEGAMIEDEQEMAK